jgi:hypothetical protein
VCLMLTHVEFRSDQFPPLEGEEALVNPDLWGRRLAEFLRYALSCEGFEVSQPIRGLGMAAGCA